MNIETLSNGLFAWLADVTLQSTVILALAGGMVILRPRMSAARKHFLLAAALISVPALMLSSGLAPMWQPFRHDASNVVASQPQIQPSVALPLADPFSVQRSDPFRDTAPEETEVLVTPSHFQAVSWRAVAGGLWLAGIAMVILALMRSALALRRLRRAATPETDARLLGHFRDAQAALKLVLPDSTLRRSIECTVPMTWGWRKRTILLPQEAVEWSDARLQLVLRHELGHIARGDVAVSLLTTVSAALLWFHPFVWLSWRVCNVAREQACDDVALAHGESSCVDFADELLQAVTALKSHRRPLLPLALAMASSSQASVLRSRLASILDDRRVRLPWARSQPLTLTASTPSLAFVLSGLTACREASKPAEPQILLTSKIFSVPFDSPVLTKAGLTLGDGPAFSLVGIHDEAATTDLLDKLKAAPGVDLMSAPSVTTRNHQRATMEVAREFVYPTEFDPPQIIEGKPMTPTTPTAFEMRPVGVRIEFLPEIAEDGSIALTLAPDITSFRGFINFGSPIKGSSLGADGKPHEFIVSENVINQPIFYSLKTTTSVSMRDGQSVVLGGLAGFGKVSTNPSKPTIEAANLEAKPDMIYYFIIQAKILR